MEWRSWLIATAIGLMFLVLLRISELIARIEILEQEMSNTVNLDSITKVLRIKQSDLTGKEPEEKKP